MDQNTYSLRPGTLLKSNDMTYVIERVLGRGGFGITYLAVAKIRIGNIEQELRFAIKEHFVKNLCSRGAESQRVEFSDPVADTVMSSRNAFLREAHRLQKLGIDHPNIVHINEVFETNNTAYYVMEYLGDSSLKDYVEKHGKLSLEGTATILRPVMEAVAVLHDNKLTHYDIKPGNIMMSARSGKSLHPVLIDFGLAKHYDGEGQPTSQITDSGYTAGYAPAQQYVGLTEFSPRCDVYALAATTYFCLTGTKPPEALSVRPENIVATLEPLVGRRAADAVAHGMAMLECDRTPDARTLAGEIFADCGESEIHVEAMEIEVVPVDVEDGVASVKSVAKSTKNCGGPKRRGMAGWIWIVVAFVLLGGAAAYYFLFLDKPAVSTPAETSDTGMSVEAAGVTDGEPAEEKTESEIVGPDEDGVTLTQDEKETVIAESEVKEAEKKNTETKKPLTEPGKTNEDKKDVSVPRNVECRNIIVNVSDMWAPPVYSKSIKAAISGSVTFGVSFDKNGKPTSLTVEKNSGLDNATLDDCRNLLLREKFTYKTGSTVSGGSARVIFHFMNTK